MQNVKRKGEKICLCLILLISLKLNAQYPKTKKIGNDSVVIITIGQADTINQLYKSYNDTIKILQLKLKKNDSLLRTRTIEKDSFYNWKYKYSVNKSIYEDYESNQRKVDKIHALSKIMLMFIIVLQFSQLH
jgi:hypothetical protein